MRGKFVTLEGIEGVGKSTNLAYVRDILRQRGLDVVTTREPGGTPVAERIRELILATDRNELPDVGELLMIFAARAVHINGLIEPALASGSWVVCDRFTDASYAYQGGGRGLDRNLIATLEQSVQGKLRPDLTLLLDAPVGVSEQRREIRQGAIDRFEIEETEFFGRVRDAYLEIALAEPSRVRIIDASQDLSDVQSELQKIIDVFIVNTVN